MPRGRSWQSVTMVETGKAEVSNTLSLYWLVKKHSDAIASLVGRLDFCCMGALTILWLHLVIVGG